MTNPEKPTQRKIYLSAAFGRREELLAYADQLAQAGHKLTSKWIHGEAHLVPWKYRKNWTTDLGNDEEVDPHAEPIAIQDYNDLVEADTIVFFSEKPSEPQPRGSRHVEFGIALSMGMDILVIGPRENLFHTMPGIRHWANWTDFQDNGPCFQQDKVTQQA